MSDQNPEPRSESLYILRLLVLVDLLCHRYRSLTLEGIQERLRKRNLSVSDRQLQRDLKLLTTHFGIGSEADEDNPARNRWMQKAPATWRHAFSSGSHGNADRGSDPFSCRSSDSRAITFGASASSVKGHVLKLIRILMIVEALPCEDEHAWFSTQDIVHALEANGMKVTTRTVQRDLTFIREHFLVLSERDRTNQQWWQRLDSCGWEDIFEPRFPRLDLSKEPAVLDFLYGRAQPGRWLH